MKLRRLALATSALLAAASLVAQTAAPAGTLTIEEAIQRALKRNFTLEANRFNPQIAADQIDIAQSANLPSFSFSTSRGITRTAQNGATLGTKIETGDTRLSVSEIFPTGTTASVSTKLDRTETSYASAVNPAYNADLTVSLRQPLLAGAGLEVNRAPIQRARIGLERANLTYQASVLSVIQSTENAYYTLAYAREQLEVRNFTLSLAQRLLDEAQTRRQTGVATDLDVLQADVGVANARRGVLLAQQDVKDSEEALLALIGQFELDAPIGRVTLPAAVAALPTFASSYDAAKRHQPDYLAAKMALDQLQLDARVAKSNRLPDVSVGGAVGFDSFASTSNRRAIDSALDRDSTAWQLDLRVELPWGQKADRARYRQALAALSQQEITVRSLEQNIEVQVRAAVRAVETNAESVKISAQARELSEKQYELERARFDAGLSTSYRVLQVQNDLETAKVNELQAKVALRNSYTALYRLEGSALQRYGITLE